MSKIIKLALSLIFVFACFVSAASYPYDPAKIFTQVDRDAAIIAIDAFRKDGAWNVNNKSYVSLGSVVTAEEAKAITYLEFKAKAAQVNATQYAIDFFAWIFRRDDVDFLTAYFKDADINDTRSAQRKFYALPGRKSALDIEIGAYTKVVEDGMKDVDAANMVKKIGAFGIATCRNYINRMNELPRETALAKLKDLKRVIYKNISAGDDWKSLLVDLEIAIQALN